MNHSLHFTGTKQHSAKTGGGSSLLKGVVSKINADRQAKKIVKAMCEVKDFESGKKQPKSFDDFLAEL